MAISDSTGKSAKSKTDQAIDYMAEQGVSALMAAAHFGLNHTTIYRRIKLLAATADRRCPCCGQLVKS